MQSVIDDSMTFLIASPFVMEESGKAFGEFQKYLADYPVESLFIAIPHFIIRDALRNS